MNKYTAVVVIGVLVLAGAFVLYSSLDESGSRVANAADVTLHKSPSCGCCAVWGRYMEGVGYGVDVHETNDLTAIKSDLGVPSEVESCHTSEIDGYVVEGHIPYEAIEKLLSERPDIHGIGMAGMPAGSPGMPGPKTEDFVVYEITDDGERGEVFMTI